MKFFCVSVKSRAALAVFLILAAVLLVSLEFVNLGSKIDKKILTNEDRVNVINSLGYDVIPDAVEVKEITIPKTFSDVYTEYNKLQQKAGYNLLNYSGYDVVIYKYKLSGTADEMFVNIIICDGLLIGGDVSAARLGGEMLPLR